MTRLVVLRSRRADDMCALPSLALLVRDRGREGLGDERRRDRADAHERRGDEEGAGETGEARRSERRGGEPRTREQSERVRVEARWDLARLEAERATETPLVEEVGTALLT